MSLLIHGQASLIDTIQKYIYAYKQIISNEGKLESDLRLDNPHKLSIENKYYTADILVHVLDVLQTTNDHSVETYEGIILIPHEDQNDLNHIQYRLANDATEKDLRLRLLVAVKDKEEDISAEETQSNVLWALDHGFEYIEIFTNKLAESHQDRDKVGLPRLIEAMESTMWSTVQRKAKPTALPTTAPNTNIATATDNNSNSTTCTAAATVAPSDTTIESKETDRENPFLPAQPEEEEEDDDLHVFSQLAQAMEQARMVRDRARNEHLSDAERRDQAAKMMLKFAELLGLDESDDDA